MVIDLGVDLILRLGELHSARQAYRVSEAEGRHLQIDIPNYHSGGLRVEL